MALTLKEIAKLSGGELVGDGDVLISNVSRIEDAKEGDLTFLANPKYAHHLPKTGASAFIVPNSLAIEISRPIIRAENPYLVFLKVVNIFYPQKPLIDKGIHSTAVIAESTSIGSEPSIGAYVVIGKECTIGDRCTILPGVVLGNGIQVGDDCLIYANVSLRDGVRLGNRIILHNGVVLGSDGFGFTPDASGQYHKIPQVGTVVVEDDVEIGANTTIDRASLGETRIKNGVKLDNLIQIGHNCSVGSHTVISAQAGLSGSTHIGNHVRVGGQAGFGGHIHIGDGAAVGAQAGVAKNVPPKVMVSGYPARPHQEELRMEAAARKMPQLVKEFKLLQRKVQELEEKLKKLC